MQPLTQESTSVCLGNGQKMDNLAPFGKWHLADRHSQICEPGKIAVYSESCRATFSPYFYDARPFRKNVLTITEVANSVE